MTEATRKKRGSISDEEKFMRERADVLLAETREGSRNWRRESPKTALTKLHIPVHEGSSGYDIWLRLVKRDLNGDQGYILTSHEVGLFEGDYDLGSNRYEQVKELGDLVFRESQQFL